LKFPRQSLDALAARLKLEPNELITIVEGPSDAKILGTWADNDGLDIVFYPVQDFEIEAEPDLEVYGGNKSRLISLMRAAILQEFADYNLIGLIDRDIDEDRNRTVVLRGLYYTVFSCLMSRLVEYERIKLVVDSLTVKYVSRDIITEIITFSWKYYHVRVLRDELNPSYKLPPLKDYVRRLSDGAFDWDQYNDKLSKFGGIPANSLVNLPTVRMGEVKYKVHFHSMVEYAHLLGKEERFFSQEISIAEVGRHFRQNFLADLDSCPVIIKIRDKYNQLTATPIITESA
jgi:hypothetical protein